MKNEIIKYLAIFFVVLIISKLCEYLFLLKMSYGFILIHTVIFFLFLILLCVFIIACFILPKGKDKTLLVSYIFVIIFGAFLLSYTIKSAIDKFYGFADENKIIVYIFTSLFIMAISFIAIIKKQSKYIDSFFNRLLFPTIILLFTIELSRPAGILLNNRFLENINSFFIDYSSFYYPVYLTVILNNIIRRIKIKAGKRAFIVMFKIKE